MQIQVSGKHVDVGDALGSRISQELEDGIGKYFERGGENAEVVVSRDGHQFKVDCWVRLASGQTLVTHGLGGDAPAAMVIAESQSEIRTLTVGRAVLELDLTGYPVMLFRNAGHGGISVVYRRPDGNIGWIDPERTQPSRNGQGS